VLHFEYGSLLRRIGDAQGALSALQRAVQLDSKDPRFRSRLGALLVERKEYEKAEAELRQARLGNDRYAETWFSLARALSGQGKLSEAIDNIRRAVEIEPDNPEYLYFLGLIYEQGQQIQDAVESFQKSIAKNPKNADAYEHLGQNLNMQNRFLEAVTAFKKAAGLDPTRARLWAQIADSQQQAGDLDGAIGSYQKSLAQDPNQPGVWSRLGIAYKDRGCTGCKNRAIEALKRAEVVDPKDWVAHHELGYLYKDDGRRAEAIAQFRKYLNLRPDAGDMETVRDDIYFLQEESRRTP
jgi:tetratricopeptide (TPR) repeat protein